MSAPKANARPLIITMRGLGPPLLIIATGLGRWFLVFIAIGASLCFASLVGAFLSALFALLN